VIPKPAQYFSSTSNDKDLQTPSVNISVAEFESYEGKDMEKR